MFVYCQEEVVVIKKDTWEDDMLIMDIFDGQPTVWHIDWHNNDMKLWSDLELMANNKQQATFKP